MPLFDTLKIEFCEGDTPEALFARAMDRLQPFLSNLSNDEGSWKSLKITKEMALKKNIHIAYGSEELWKTYKILAEELEKNGFFHKPENKM